MALPIRQKAMIAVCCLVLFIFVEIYILSVHFETRAVLFRAHFIILVQVLLYFISKFLWNNLTNFDPTVAFVTSTQTGSVSQTSFTSTSASSSDRNPLSSDGGRKNFTLWKIVLFVYLILCHISYFTNLFFIRKEPHWLSMLAYCCLGSYVQLATGMVALKTVTLLISLRTDISLRGTVLSKRMTAVLVVLYATGATFWGLTAAIQNPIVKAVTIPIRGLPAVWDGKHIVQLSDIHLGPTVGYSKLSTIVDMVNKLEPDLVVITGDLVDGSVKLLGEAVLPLARIKSPLGKYFVSGNHEYYTGDVDNWFAKLKMDVDFTVLHNTNIKIVPKPGKANDAICLAGADDVDAFVMRYDGHGFDPNQALRTCDPNKPVIFLAHQPKAAKLALDSGYRIDLVLSGHTHGGQLFPLTIVAYLANPFYAGLYKYREDSYIYVSQGTQYWGIPMRLGTTMEITDITLVSV